MAELINKAVTANPTEKMPRLLLIDLHLRSKDHKLALSAAQNAVAAIPDSPELFDALGRAQQASGETNQALISFNKFAALAPNSPLPHMRMAEAHMQAKDKSAAAQSLRKALDIKPDQLDAQRGLIDAGAGCQELLRSDRIARTIQKQRPKEASDTSSKATSRPLQKNWDAAAEAYRAIGLKQGAGSRTGRPSCIRCLPPARPARPTSWPPTG